MPSEHQKRIVEFMRRAGQEVPESVHNAQIISPNMLKLRAELIFEEAYELLAGLGFDIGYQEGYGTFLEPTGDPPNIEEIIDGCADLSVVTIGTLAALGVDDEPVLREVDEANLRKFGEGSYRREDGKWMKPPDFVPPNVLAAAARGKEL